MNLRFLPPGRFTCVDPNLDPFSTRCICRLRDWADSVEDPGSARFDKDLLGVGSSDDATPSPEGRDD